MADRRETDLYDPIKGFLTAQGYEVKGEVTGCDMVALRGDDLVVVELKVRFNLELVLQGVQRQRLTETVYLGVEAPRRTRGERWGEVQALCRRLGLGLLTVDFQRRTPRVDVVLPCGAAEPRKATRQRHQLLQEFAQRTGDFNTGGSTRRAIVTAYREDGLRIATYLREMGPAKVGVVRTALGLPKTQSILHDNVYGWFDRVDRGVYALSPAGQAALVTYADVVAAQL